MCGCGVITFCACQGVIHEGGFLVFVHVWKELFELVADSREVRVD